MDLIHLKVPEHYNIWDKQRWHNIKFTLIGIEHACIMLGKGKLVKELQIELLKHFIKTQEDNYVFKDLLKCLSP